MHKLFHGNRKKIIHLSILLLGAVLLSLLAEVLLFNWSAITNPTYREPAADVVYEQITEGEDGQITLQSDEASRIVITGIDRYVQKLSFDIRCDLPAIGLTVFVNGEQSENSDPNNMLETSVNIPHKTININQEASSIEIYFENAAGRTVTLDNIELSNLFIFNPLRFVIMLVSLCLAAGIALYFVRTKGKVRLEKVAVLFILLFGIILSFFTPPHATWDEYSHFLRSYNVAKGNLFYQLDEEMEYPKNLDRLNIGYSQYLTYEEYGVTMQDLAQYTTHDTEQVVKNTQQVVYTAVPYIPSGIGVFLSLLFDLPIIFCLWFGRLANVILYAVLCYFAIKITPISKKLLFFFSVLPVCIFLSASFSCDVMINGLTLLGIAVLFKVMHSREPIRRADTLLLFLIFTLITLAKSTYAPLFLLLLLVRKENFNSVKHRRWFRTGAILAAVVLFAVTFLYGQRDGLAQWQIPGADVGGQIHYILTHPFEYMGVLWNTLGSSLFRLTTSSFSSIAYLGYLNEITLLLTCFLLVFTAITDNAANGQLVRARERWTISISLLITLVVSMTALYVTFTPMRSLSVDGFQGRYLFPLIILALTMVQNRHVTSTLRDEPFNAVLCGSALFLNFNLLCLLFGGFYS